MPHERLLLASINTNTSINPSLHDGASLCPLSIFYNLIDFVGKGWHRFCCGVEGNSTAIILSSVLAHVEHAVFVDLPALHTYTLSSKHGIQLYVQGSGSRYSVLQEWDGTRERHRDAALAL